MAQVRNAMVITTAHWFYHRTKQVAVEEGCQEFGTRYPKMP